MKRTSWILIAALAVAIGGAAAWFALREKAPAPVDFALPPDPNFGIDGISSPPAISPDGQWLVYPSTDASGTDRLWLRRLPDGRGRRIEGSDFARMPFWSPDSATIAFFAHDELRRIPLRGGAATTIARAPAGRGGTWNRDGDILFSSEGNILRVSANGGAPALAMHKSTLNVAALRWPRFLPDGEHYVFHGRSGRMGLKGWTGIYFASLRDTKTFRFVTEADAQAVFVPDGRLLTVHNGEIHARRFDPNSGALDGASRRLGRVQVYTDSNAFFDATATMLLYQPEAQRPLSQLLLKDRTGKTIRTIAKPSFYFGPRVSPDGHRIAVDQSDRKSGLGDIWIYDVDRDRAERFTVDPRNETLPIWSPRGDAIVFLRSGEVQGSTTWLQRLDGAGEAAVIVDDPENATVLPGDWSRDGKHFVYVRIGGSGGIVVYSFADRSIVDLPDPGPSSDYPTFSPDGKWIAYQAIVDGRFEILVQPFPPDGSVQRVTTSGGIAPRWPSRNELLYATSASTVMSVPVSTSPTFEAGTPAALFRFEQRYIDESEFDVLPDGTFVVNELVPGQRGATTMRMIRNW